MDFLQQLSQSANLFDNKEEILNVAANSIFYALHNVWKASKKDYLKTDLLFVVWRCIFVIDEDIV